MERDKMALSNCRSTSLQAHSTIPEKYPTVSDQPKCHPGTRVAILRYLEAWARALTYLYPIIWLHGPAGSGKSSILRTIAQILFDQDFLLASFFFFRSSVGRNSSDHFIATIAYQVARAIPLTRPYIEQAIEREPLIFALSLWDQAQALIVSPILAVRADNPIYDFCQFPRVIIIDGLDECHDPDKQCGILEVVCRILQELPIPLAVLIASRPEHHIRCAFDLGSLNKSSSRLALDNSYEPDADIKKYLVDRFRSIQESHPLKSCLPASSPWPSREIVDNLVAKASGQFIYGSTVDKFVSSIRHNPVKRLEMMLGIIDSGNLKPFEQLDNLYSAIFSTIDPENLAGTLRILGVLLVPYHEVESPGKPIRYSVNFLQHILKVDAGDIYTLLFDLESLLTIDGGIEVHFFHASLGDYLFDRSRSGRFSIDTGMVYADLAQLCIVRLSEPIVWTELRPIFNQNGVLFFSKATPTPELRQAIEHCDLVDVVDFSLWTDGSNFLSDITPTLLQAIRQSAFPDANHLYLAKRASYIQIIQPSIQIYFQNMDLKHLLIATASTKVPVRERHSYHGFLRYIFKISPKHWAVLGKQGLQLEYSSDALIQVLRDLFDDDSDSNIPYFIDENQYADITLNLVNVMTQHPRVLLGEPCYFRPPLLLVQQCMSRIFRVLLSKSSTRQDLLDQIKNIQIDHWYPEFEYIEDEIKTYISRSETDLGSVSALEHKSAQIIFPDQAESSTSSIQATPPPSDALDLRPDHAGHDVSDTSKRRLTRRKAPVEYHTPSGPGEGRGLRKWLRMRARVDNA